MSLFFSVESNVLSDFSSALTPVEYLVSVDGKEVWSQILMEVAIHVI